MRTRSHARRRMSVLLLAVSVGSVGCHTWKPVMGPSITSPATHESVEYRLTAHTGESRRFVSLQLRNDSLVGRQVQGARPVIPGWPISGIHKVEVRMPSDAPGVILTAALVGLVIVGATLEPFSGGL